MSEKYKTQIRNHKDDTVVLKSPKNFVYRTIFIQPHTTMTIGFNDEAYFLAPYERIVYKKSGKVEIVKRKGFKRDLPFPSTKFLNRGGASVEVLPIQPNDSLHLPLGIPVERNVPINSFYSDFSEVIISEPKSILVPLLMNPGQLKEEKKQHIIYRKRPEKELQKIRQMREVAYLRSVGLGTPVGE